MNSSQTNSQIQANVKTEQQTQQRKKQRQQNQPSDMLECPHCHRQVGKNNLYCPYCGHKLVDYCTFCGASMDPHETVCEECGMPSNGVKCPKCGTINVRPFCRKCNEPLTRAALRTIEKVKQDPKVQKAAAMMDKAAELEEKIERLKSGKTTHDAPILTEAERFMMNLFGTNKEEAQTQQTAEDDNLEEIEKEYNQLVDDINATLESMMPPSGSTPQEEFNYFSAVKVAVEATRKVTRKIVQRVPTGWVCNRCHVHHNHPSECCVKEFGGRWIYKKITVTEEYTENYTTYNIE